MESKCIKKQKKSNHINLDERIKIELGLALGKSIRKIAIELKRSVSSISEEIRKGKYNGKYRTLIADKRAIVRKQQSHKQGKKHTKLLHHAKVSLIPQRVDISLRPEVINNRERIGDIEAD